MSRPRPVDESFFLRKKRRGAMWGLKHYVTRISLKDGAAGYVRRLKDDLVDEDVTAFFSTSRSEAKHVGRMWLAVNNEHGSITPVPVEESS